MVSRIPAAPKGAAGALGAAEGGRAADGLAAHGAGGGAAVEQMMMMSFICSCRNKIGAELHIYLKEGTYHKRA